MTTEIHFDGEARLAMLSGVDLLADAVQTTLGPCGRNVVLETDGAPRSTKDGARVARSVIPAGAIEAAGAGFVRDLALQAKEAGGDGTTTAIVIARAALREGVKLVAAGHDPVDVKRGMDLAAKAAGKRLAELAQPVRGREDLLDVALVACNGERDVAELAVRAWTETGLEGALSVREAGGMYSHLELHQGIRLPNGWLSHHFTDDGDGDVCSLHAPRLLLHDGEVASLRALLPVLEDAAEGGSALLIVARGFSKEVLAALALNAREGVLRVAAVKAPEREIMEDLAALGGAAIVGDERGVSLGALGQAELGALESATVGPQETVLIGAASGAERAAERAAQIRAELATTSHHQRRRDLHERLASLSEGVAVVHVGGRTGFEARERLDRTQDAIRAVAAAAAEGVVPGGGAALLHAAAAAASPALANNEAQLAGAAAMRMALEAPLRQIADNAGADGSYVVNLLRGAETPAMGYDARRREIAGMLESGILDTVVAACSALTCARSVAGMLVGVEAAVVAGEEAEHA